jgi:hypothetical protein
MVAVICLCAPWLQWPRTAAAAATKASLCWNAVLAGKDKLAIVVLPQIYDVGAKTDSWSTVYYMVVSLEKDVAGHYPYQLFGPMPAGNNPMVNGQRRQVGDRSMHGSFFDERGVSYDLKPDGRLVRWQPTGKAIDRTFRRSVLDVASHRWADLQSVTSPKNEDVLSYAKRQYGEFAIADVQPETQHGTAPHDHTEDKWPNDRWFSKVMTALNEIGGARWVATNDRNWIFAEFENDWLRDDAEYRGKAPVEAAFRDLRFDRRTQILKFHRGDDKPTVMDRFENASGPRRALLDEHGEVWLWYGPYHFEQNQIFDNLALVSLKGKTSPVLQRINIDYHFLYLDENYSFDASHSMLTQMYGESGAVQGDVEGTTLPLYFGVYTVSLIDGKRTNQGIDLKNVFEVRGGKVVPREKEATPVSD